MAFGDKTVREVMTPRPNIVAIAAERSLEDLRQLVIHEQFSRIPVFENTIDQVIGFVHVRDMFELDPATSAKQDGPRSDPAYPADSGDQAGERIVARDAARRRAYGSGDR